VGDRVWDEELDRHQRRQEGLADSESVDANNSILIDTRPFQLPADDGYFSAGTRWREPVFAHVADTLNRATS